MRNTAQTGFNTADNHRYVFVGFFTALGVDGNRPVRPLAANIARCIGIVMAQLFISGVAVNHRVHIAGRHTKKQVGLTQAHKVIFAVPVRLGNNAHPIALGF